MRAMLNAVAVLGLIILCGCNTTDALTPQADVPNASNDGAAAPRRVASAGQLGESESQPVEPEQATRSTSFDRPPQNTLEAQAAALQRGEENPSLTKDTSGNFGSNLYRSSNENSEGTDPKQVASIYSVKEAKGSIRFLPIIGAPVKSVTPLSRQLGSSARAGGLTIKGSNDASAEHVLKGYLSAFPDGGQISVVYVWDVLDASGNRLHRIQGQETAPSGGADAWSNVPDDTMQKIGNDTISQYLNWKQSQG